MKKIIGTIALVFALGLGLQAQEVETADDLQTEQGKKQTPEERAKLDAERAEKRLALTTDQKLRWETAAKSRIEANGPIRQKMKGSMTPEERSKLHSEAKANNEKFESAINEFLTADQKARYGEMKKERLEKKKGHAGHRKGGKQPLNEKKK